MILMHWLCICLSISYTVPKVELGEYGQEQIVPNFNNEQACEINWTKKQRYIALMILKWRLLMRGIHQVIRDSHLATLSQNSSHLVIDILTLSSMPLTKSLKWSTLCSLQKKQNNIFKLMRKGPETSNIFLLHGTGIVLVLFYIYPIVSYASAFLHSFILLVTVVKGKDPKRHTYFYSLVLELFSCYSISIR